jgi:hypothetical protein
MKSAGRVGTADNDINAIKDMGMISGGYTVNHYLTDSDAFFIKTRCTKWYEVFRKITELELLWKVISKLVTLDTKLEKDTASAGLTLEVSSVHQELKNFYFMGRA